MAVAAFYLCLISLCLTQVISSPSVSEADIVEAKVRQILSIAEAVRAVDRAGGPAKIMEDPSFKGLKPYVQKAIIGLLKMEEDQRRADEEEIKPRSRGALVALAVISSPSESEADIFEEKVRQVLSVAEAVRAVDRAGGPAKIMEDPSFKGLKPYVQKAIVGLLKMEEDQKKADEMETKPRRFWGALIKIAVRLLEHVIIPIAVDSAVDLLPTPKTNN